MSYCLNPTCPSPENLVNSQRCQSCGSPLLLHDRYRVVQPLGQGGFGATFLATNQSLPGKPSCVIKQLRPSGNAPHILQMARELFEREAKTLGNLGNHPQIPGLLNYFEENEHFYLVQEYISGATLQQEVKRNGVYSEAGVKQFLSEVLPLLQYIHERKVIHRDIKPANLIRRAHDSRLVLIDFGAVKNQVQSMLDHSGQTALTAYAIGTPGFAPPEQMAMRPVYASDIYALGVTCIYLLTSKTPKDLEYNPTTGEVLWEHLVHASDHLINVLRKMLEVSVRNRYQSAQDVLRVLEIEPYVESLSQGLIAKPNFAAKKQTNNYQENSAILYGDSQSNTNPPTSPTNSKYANLAEAIRAKKAKDAEAASQARRMPQGTKSTTLSNSNGSYGSNTRQPRPERKLDTQSILAAYLKGRRDFALHNLSLLSLSGANLSGTNFHSAQLQKINLQRANLQNSDFSRARLTNANLQEANLSKSYFNHADLEGANLRGADLSQAHLNQANLRGANLCGANLSGAKITDEQIALAKTNWNTVRPDGKRGFLPSKNN